MEREIVTNALTKRGAEVAKLAPLQYLVLTMLPIIK